MTPLTVDCARIRQLIPAYYDGALGEADQASVAAHLEECTGCTEALEGLSGALAALDTLSAEDLTRLRADLPPEVGELNTRPLARMVALVALCGLIVTLALIWRATSSAPTSSPRAVGPGEPTQVAEATVQLPTIGGMIGVEADEEYDASRRAQPVELAAAAVEPPPVVEPVPAPAPEASEPKPVEEAGDAIVAAKDARVGDDPVAGDDPPDARPDPPPPADPDPLPAPVQAELARLQLSKGGIRYQELILFFVRDPEGRDRLGRSRPSRVASAREASPADPKQCLVKAPSGRSSWNMLEGELIDAPFGLRIALRSEELRRRSSVAVLPMVFDGLRDRRDRAPFLKGPVLLPSDARHALVSGEQPGPVAELLKDLNDPSLLEFRRLRNELGQLESEARDLERRLRALIRSTRGLRGMAISVNMTHRSLDVFASSKDFSDAIPKLLRTALLEAALEKDVPEEDLFGDTGSLNMYEGLATRTEHVALLALLREVEREKGVVPYTVSAREGVAAVHLGNDDELFHGAVLRGK